MFNGLHYLETFEAMRLEFSTCSSYTTTTLLAYYTSYFVKCTHS
jgi:hypothetical protein